MSGGRSGARRCPERGLPGVAAEDPRSSASMPLHPPTIRRRLLLPRLRSRWRYWPGGQSRQGLGGGVRPGACDAGEIGHLDAEWAGQWSSTIVHLKPKTREGSESLLANLILPEFATVSLAAITTVRVKGWVAELTRRGLSSSRVRRPTVRPTNCSR
jgi:hypothetical protein